MELIENQVRRGYFIFRLPSSGSGMRRCQRYRYHPLFRRFLLQKARRSLPEHKWHALLRSGARRLERMGQPEQALPLLLEAQAWLEICRVLKQHAPGLLESGRHDLLNKWLAEVPADVSRDHGWLAHWHASARLPFDPGEANRLYSQAFDSFVATKDSEGMLLSWCGGVQSLLYGWGSFCDLDRWLDAHQSELKGHKSRSLSVDARVASTLYGALVFRRPQSPDIAEWETRVRRFMLMSRLLDPHHYVLLAVNVFHHDLWRGKTLQAGALLQSLSAVVRSKRVGPVSALAWHTMRAVYGHFTGDGAASMQASREGLRLAKEWGVRFWDFLLLAQGAFGAIVEGDLDQAREALEQMGDQLQPERHLENLVYYDALAQADLLEGRLPRAIVHAELAVEHALSLGSPFPEAILRIGASQAHFAAGQQAEAYRHLEQAENIVRQAGSTILTARIELARAEYCLGSPDPEAAKPHLELGFSLCAKHGYLGFPWWRAKVVASLCESALRHDIEPEFVRSLMRVRRLAPSSPSQASAEYPVRVVTLASALTVSVEGERLSCSGRSQRRPMELLGALIALGGSEVRAATLADALWPDSDGDSAQRALGITLHRLRRLIGPEAVVRTRGSLSLAPQLCTVDCIECERLLDRLHAENSSDGRLLGQVLNLYRRPFLDGHDAAWAVSYRARLSSKFIAGIVTAMEHADGSVALAQSTEWGERALQAEPSSETLHRTLIANLCARGMSARAADAYRRCRESLKVHFDSGPSSETQRIAQHAGVRPAP